MKNIAFLILLCASFTTPCLMAQITLQYSSSTPISSRLLVSGAGERYSRVFIVDDLYTIAWKDGNFTDVGSTAIDNMPVSQNPFAGRFTADWLDQDEDIEFVLSWRPANSSTIYAIFDDNGKMLSPVFQNIPLNYSDGIERKIQVADTVLRVPDLSIDHVFSDGITEIFRTQVGEDNAFRYAYVNKNTKMVLMTPNYEVEKTFSVDPQLFNCLSNIQVLGSHLVNNDEAFEWFAESLCNNGYSFRVFSDSKELSKISFPIGTAVYSFYAILYPRDYAGFTTPKIVLKKGEDSLLVHDLLSGVLEYSIAAQNWVSRRGITNELKYSPFFFDTLDTEIKIFNPDGKLWKTIPKTESLDFFAADFSSTTYDNDASNVEVFGYYILPNNMKKFRVIREDGSILFSLDNFTSGSVSRLPGLENKLIFNRIGQGLSTESRVYRLPSSFLGENEPMQKAPLPFSVSPNPFKQQIQVRFAEATDKIKSVQLFNLLGQMVYQQMSFDTLLDLPEELPSGTYFLQLNTQDRSGTVKLVKE